MRERPILFSGPMVRAILDGTKTQTRRVAMHTVCGVRVARLAFDPAPELATCPYGVPGDRLWVRETWKLLPECGYLYRADPPFGADSYERGWKPSIHMPRRASRLTLEVTDVRVERLQEISEADARAEGAAEYARTSLGYPDAYTSRDQFEYLWDSLNAARGYGWDANPWVWVVSFRRMEA